MEKIQHQTSNVRRTDPDPNSEVERMSEAEIFLLYLRRLNKVYDRGLTYYYYLRGLDGIITINSTHLLIWFKKLTQLIYNDLFNPSKLDWVGLDLSTSKLKTFFLATIYLINYLS